MHNTSSAIDK